MSQLPARRSPEHFWPTINRAIKNGGIKNADNEPVNPQCPICFDTVSVRSFPNEALNGDRDGEVLICGHIFCHACRDEFDRNTRKATCPVCRTPLLCRRCGACAIPYCIPQNGDGGEVGVPTTLPEGAEHGLLCPDCTATEEFHDNVEKGEWPGALDDLEPGLVNFFYHIVDKLEKKGSVATRKAIVGAFVKAVDDEFTDMMLARYDFVHERGDTHREKNICALNFLRALLASERPLLSDYGARTPMLHEETSPVDYTRVDNSQEPPLVRDGPRPTIENANLNLADNTPLDFADTTLPLQFAGLTTEPESSGGEDPNAPRTGSPNLRVIASLSFRRTQQGTTEYRMEQSLEEFITNPPRRIDLSRGIYFEPRGSSEEDRVVTTIMELVDPNRPVYNDRIPLGTPVDESFSDSDMLTPTSEDSDYDFRQPVSER
ncbi:hypothetical protein FBEOM_3729 [Fusarium beomiforme]|uniref:RING-type domain-containing protein n=1 Tax=Fusarium beomiforme TaxID=44412 RepID=A0A9P5AR41_9HYPO|nr:hypothetical protein FBEOM_3729 [Fusarium beomiforme]